MKNSNQIKLDRERVVRQEKEAVERHLPDLAGSAASVSGSVGTVGFSGEFEIFKVVSAAIGGGYYDCYLQVLDYTKWDSDDDPFSNTGDIVTVLNLSEYGEDIHNLSAGALIMCWVFYDSGNFKRYIGNEVFGRHAFGEW